MRTTKPWLKVALASSFVCHLLATSYAQATAHPAPSTVSPQMATAISAPAPELWQLDLNSDEELISLRQEVDQSTVKSVKQKIKVFKVNVQKSSIADVPVFVLEPKRDAVGYGKIDSNKVILFLHGGGYVFGQGLASISEAIPLSGLHGYTVICVDYRMAPENPYPAAIDDAFLVYKELLKSHKAQDIAVFGSSTGGAMTLILALQAIDAKVTLPSVLIAGSPWSDLTRTGDSYTINDGVDNILGSYDHLLKISAESYADSNDMSEPFLSPINASDNNLQQFPPTLLLSGTRDLFLSNTVRMHTRLLQNKVKAELIVYEGQSHVQYYLVPNSPEFKQHYQFVDDFLKRIWGL